MNSQRSLQVDVNASRAVFPDNVEHSEKKTFIDKNTHECLMTVILSAY